MVSLWLLLEHAQLDCQCPLMQRWAFFSVFAVCMEMLSQVPISGISCTLHLPSFSYRESVFSLHQTTSTWREVYEALLYRACAILFPWWIMYFFKLSRCSLQKQTRQPCLQQRGKTLHGCLQNWKHRVPLSKKKKKEKRKQALCVMHNLQIQARLEWSECSILTFVTFMGLKPCTKSCTHCILGRL